MEYDEKNSIFLINKTSGDTLETGYPDRLSGQYNFIVAPGSFRLVYTGPGYYPQMSDTSIVKNTLLQGVIHLKDIILDKNPPDVYEKLDFSDIPVVEQDRSQHSHQESAGLRCH